jgi:2-amino-4-hydroxy-6-hydroxymethyldihydropteridine diphosphokinase/dihydropteroate synthase
MFKLGARELIVGLGSNSPNALEMLRQARRLLRENKLFRLIRTSPIYESDALLPSDAPADWNRPYLNAACLLEIPEKYDTHFLLNTSDDLAAQQIIDEIKRIEKQLGRIDTLRWAPRVIDLDLLAWGRSDVHTASIHVPHSGLMERPFALLPAQDCTGLTSESSLNWRYSPPENVPFKTKLSSSAWPELVGILNLTPDSFSDGGLICTPAEIERAIRKMCDEGATVIDVGAESTRPGATPIEAQEEIGRLQFSMNVVERLKNELGFKLSLDSRHAKTVAWCLERFSIDWINNVEGFSNPELLTLASQSKCDLVAMHSLGVPPSPEHVINPDRDPVTAVKEWVETCLERFDKHGIDKTRIIIDPGIGFGKTAAQNLALLARACELSQLSCRALIGHSRKRFLDPENRFLAIDRDFETALLTARLANQGVDYLRVHSPGIQARALRLGSKLL